MASLPCAQVYGQGLSAGYVQDKHSGETLGGVSIRSLQSGLIVQSNAYGFFSLRPAPEGTAYEFRLFGYQSDTLQLFPADTQIIVKLSLASLQPVEIRAERQGEGLPSPNRLQVSLERLLALPPLLGERDVIKSLAAMPGISLGIEGSSGLIVRGGAPEQNLILLDGAKVYNATHLLGLFSIFNADALSHVEIYKGNFPARYGGRLSSVLDLRMREGNTQRMKGEAGIGLLSSRFTLEGPIEKGKSAFLVTGRAGYLGLFLLPSRLRYLNEQTNNYFTYGLYDLSAKVHRRFANQGHLYASFYSSQDMFATREGRISQSETLGSIGWENQTFSLRYTRPIRQRLFVIAQGNASAYRFRTYSENRFLRLSTGQWEKESADIQSGVREWSGQIQAEYYLGRSQSLQAGINIERADFVPSSVNTYFSLTNVQTQSDTLLSSWSSSSWLEYKRSSQQWEYSAGLRHSFLGAPDSLFSFVEPRLSISYLPKSNWLLSAGIGRAVQHTHMLTSTQLGLPGDIWIPATGAFPPQRGYQLSLSASGRFEPGLRWSLEGYYRQHSEATRYRALFADLGVTNLSNWENNLQRGGSAWAYGIEVFLQAEGQLSSAWLSYTLSWAWQQFGTAPPQPFVYDRRHLLNLTYSRKLSDRWRFSSMWTFQSGRPVYLPQGSISYEPLGGSSWLYSSEFQRLPAYHRLDIGFERNVQTRKNRSRSLKIGVYNLYNRPNILFVTIEETSYSYTNGQITSIRPGRIAGQGFLPFLPSLDYSWKF